MVLCDLGMCVNKINIKFIFETLRLYLNFMGKKKKTQRVTGCLFPDTYVVIREIFQIKGKRRSAIWFGNNNYILDLLFYSCFYLL